MGPNGDNFGGGEKAGVQETWDEFSGVKKGCSDGANPYFQRKFQMPSLTVQKKENEHLRK
ncbi:hypothetical protein QJS10_CPB04g00840 [Acorus calamus]|uniref:Uncharacterized protein n=1 Tax=Acorus calamus TaxID=4465 RepID=A0AAV9F0L2_ACOCL|nr:hypothetical protein QJS10_CPB04g00840 [Acorus calamus]